jgi:hypothetical protein
MWSTRSFAMLLLTTLAPPAAAQIVTGRILDPTAAAPVEGAFVALLDQHRVRVHAVLTNSDGRFQIRAPGAGRYMLVAERIGQETVSGEFFEIADGETLSIELESPSRAIALEGLSVESDRRCAVRADRAAGAARVWDEARKALAITLWAKDNTLITFRATTYARDLDPALSIVRNETRRSHAGASPRPWTTPPPEALMRDGFAHADGDSIQYYGADAEVLLSDVFQDHHCFELHAGDGDRQGLLGLRFRPTRNRGVPDIEGTLWVEAGSGLLRFIEYRIVHAQRLLPTSAAMRDPQGRPLPRAEVNGYTGFRRLPNGIWYVDQWWIRMPALTLQSGSVHLTGWREEGGVVLHAESSISMHERPILEPPAASNPVEHRSD